MYAIMLAEGDSKIPLGYRPDFMGASILASTEAARLDLPPELPSEKVIQVIDSAGKFVLMLPPNPKGEGTHFRGKDL